MNGVPRKATQISHQALCICSVFDRFQVQISTSILRIFMLFSCLQAKERILKQSTTSLFHLTYIFSPVILIMLRSFRSTIPLYSELLCPSKNKNWITLHQSRVSSEYIQQVEKYSITEQLTTGIRGLIKIYPDWVHLFSTLRHTATEREWVWAHSRMSAIRETTLQPFRLTQPSQVKTVNVTLTSASTQKNWSYFCTKNWDDGNRNLWKPPFDSTPLTYLLSCLSPLYRFHETEEWTIKARRKTRRSSWNSIRITAQDIVCMWWGKPVTTHRWWQFRNPFYTVIRLTLSIAV